MTGAVPPSSGVVSWMIWMYIEDHRTVKGAEEDWLKSLWRLPDSSQRSFVPISKKLTAALTHALWAWLMTHDALNVKPSCTMLFWFLEGQALHAPVALCCTLQRFLSCDKNLWGQYSWNCSSITLNHSAMKHELFLAEWLLRSTPGAGEYSLPSVSFPEAWGCLPCSHI
jgi:hypothetical protein